MNIGIHRSQAKLPLWPSVPGRTLLDVRLIVGDEDGHDVLNLREIRIVVVNHLLWGNDPLVVWTHHPISLLLPVVLVG